MRAHLRSLVALLVALALLTFAASVIVARVTRGWYETDVVQRSTLVVRGARSTLVREWNDADAVRKLLEDVTRDDRIMATAACRADGTLLASTTQFPPELDCREILSLVGSDKKHLLEAPSGDALLSAVDVTGDHGTKRGFVAFLHDLSYAERRERATQRFTLAGFAVLALLASIATVLSERAAWRRLRELANEFADEAEAKRGVAWTKERLRETLTTTLRGERIIVAANREPYVHEKKGDAIEVIHPASGLVTALEPVMRACSGVWVAHGSGSADRETSDEKGRVWVPPGEKLYTTRRVWLTAEEERGYYYGFSNEGLWPLCHVAHTRPVFRASDFEAYREVNEKFACAVVDEADRDDPIVLVQDYHLALAPRFVRERSPRAAVLTFWHIPWPAAERIAICPQHQELLRGLLGSSIVGFHTQQHCNNFLEAVDRYLEARIDRELDAVYFDGHWTLVRSYPISIEWPNRWLASVPSIEECRRIVREEHGLAEDVKIGVGVDRIDYTKGIQERLHAVERLFERDPSLVGRFTFIQLGAPSRTKIAAYHDLNDEIAEITERINARFARNGWRPIIFHRAHHEPHTVFRYYRAADVCYVSSLHDGMNLVAKEFVAAREDERGVLVLSRFAGAARELSEALIVNPYDLEESSAALRTAITMSDAEQRDRMHALRSFVAEWNVYRWAGRMLLDAARLRKERRLAGRLGVEPDRASSREVRRPRIVRAVRG